GDAPYAAPPSTTSTCPQTECQQSPKLPNHASVPKEQLQQQLHQQPPVGVPQRPQPIRLAAEHPLISAFELIPTDSCSSAFPSQPSSPDLQTCNTAAKLSVLRAQKVALRVVGLALDKENMVIKAACSPEQLSAARHAALLQVPLTQRDALQAAGLPSTGGGKCFVNVPNSKHNMSGIIVALSYPPVYCQVVDCDEAAGLVFVVATSSCQGQPIFSPELLHHLLLLFKLVKPGQIPVWADTAANDMDRQQGNNGRPPWFGCSKKCEMACRRASAPHFLRAAAVPGTITVLAGARQLSHLLNAQAEASVRLVDLTDNLQLRHELDLAVQACGATPPRLGRSRIMAVVPVAQEASSAGLSVSWLVTCQHPCALSAGQEPFLHGRSMVAVEEGTLAALQAVKVLGGGHNLEQPTKQQLKEVLYMPAREGRFRTGKAARDPVRKASNKIKVCVSPKPETS
ncbi:hypothetical protein DUNSADRAFT_6563, partial [Dunaliella salina]